MYYLPSYHHCLFSFFIINNAHRLHHGPILLLKTDTHSSISCRFRLYEWFMGGQLCRLKMNEVTMVLLDKLKIMCMFEDCTPFYTNSCAQYNYRKIKRWFYEINTWFFAPTCNVGGLYVIPLVVHPAESFFGSNDYHIN